MRWTRIGLIVAFGAVTLGGAAGVVASELDEFGQAWTALLSRHVHEGAVDYAALVRKRAPLDELAARLERFDLSALSPAQAKALWIDAYNLLTIRSVVDHYPVRSPRDIPGFFDRIRHAVGGERLTLDAIERDRLRRDTGDPRIHFAVVCAARSCPEILPVAYTSSRVDDVLEERARAVANDEAHVTVADGESRISRIFHWYDGDFDVAGGVRAFLDARRPGPLPSGPIRHLRYDWTLNDTNVPEHTERARDLRAYTPSSLLVPGELEVQLFHNLYTQTEFFDDEGTKRDAGGRASYYTGFLAVTWSWHRSINPGVELTLRSVRDETFPGADDSRTALTSVTPRVELAPFSRFPRLSLETGLRIPLGSDFEGDAGRPFLDFDDPIWSTKLFWDYEWSTDFLGYFETGTLLRFDSQEAQLSTPTKAIFNWYPGDRWTVYVPFEIGPDWIGDAGGNYYSQVGVGLKVRPVPNVELETLGTLFPVGKNAGAGQTINLGLRWIR